LNTTVKALRRFTVRPQLPPALQPLGPLIRNLRWAWHPASQDLFADIDRALWTRFEADPVKLLGAVSVARLDELAVDESFLARMHGLAADLDHCLTDPRWYQQQIEVGARYPAAIAYFSMEFGVTEALPNYSGGLGILAGDHLKSASDLGVPIIGVGLLYRYGYFWQSLSADGWQQEHYPAHDPQGLPIDRVLGPDGEQLAITIPMPGERTLTARIWCAQVGRVPLLLLDADNEHNDDALRATTDRLYGGDQDHRIKQEMLLGIGGVRAVNAYAAITGHPHPEVFHMNEGHAGFLGLERIRSLIADHGLTFGEALSAVRAGTVFTTHTPVPAGIDRFPIDLVRHYLDGVTDGSSRLLPRGRRRGGARARRRGRSRPVQHGAHGSAAGPTGQRRGQAARGRVPSDVRRAVPRLRAGRGAHRIGDQRRAPADLGGQGDVRRGRRHGRLARSGLSRNLAVRREGVPGAVVGAA
jgi:starch phosphorylase